MKQFQDRIRAEGRVLPGNIIKVDGFLNHRVDTALMRFTELFQTIPSFVLAVVLVAIFRPSLGSIVFSIAIVSWPPVARVVRAEFLSLRAREFVQAAEVLGRSRTAIIFREILPNALSPIIVLASLMVASAILLESALSFLGLGVKAPNSSWGTLIKEGADRMEVSPELLLFPALLFSATLLALNFLGDGLRDALDPKSSKD